MSISMKVRCPTCKKKTEWKKNPYRPFCSERCKLIDLGAWASEEYKVKGEDISRESSTNNDESLSQ
ncbi:MAG: DNA gyrase inhibitor YacG [Nitrospiraceae bacterium]|nr:MAG: DNA gyrase inhibitor YacG [Nitrospiraceae bacterium]